MKTPASLPFMLMTTKCIHFQESQVLTTKYQLISIPLLILKARIHVTGYRYFTNNIMITIACRHLNGSVATPGNTKTALV